MGKSMDLLEGSRSLMEGERERESSFSVLDELERAGARRETLGRKMMGINTPSAPTAT